MVLWKTILGVVVGAVLVKESRRAARTYDILREKLVASVDKLRAKTDEPDVASGDHGHDSSVSPALN